MNAKIVIAVSGKGGVGKTALSALLVTHLSKHGSVLAVDADPDFNLPNALGVDVSKTVGGIREAIVQAPDRSKVAESKKDTLQAHLHAIIEEFPSFDLVAMGRSEGLGCYCAVNLTIREVIDSQASSYDFTVVDCEPGLEHLSRRTTRDVDIMLVVSEPTVNGLLTAKRVKDLAKELSIQFGKIWVVANKITPETKPIVDKLAKENGLEIIAYLPYDPAVAQFDLAGKPIAELPPDSPIVVAVDKLCTTILEYAAVPS